MKKEINKTNKVKRGFEINNRNVDKVVGDVVKKLKSKKGVENKGFAGKVSDIKIYKPGQPLLKGKYKLSVYISGECFETKTNDLKEAILALKPEKITNKVRIIVENGDTKIEKILFVFQARRIFKIPLATEFFVKNLILALK